MTPADAIRISQEYARRVVAAKFSPLQQVRHFTRDELIVLLVEAWAEGMIEAGKFLVKESKKQ